MSDDEKCALCGEPDGGVSHLAPEFCVYETCEYDEAADKRGVYTGSAKYPHPRPHHQFRTQQIETVN